MTYLLLQSDTHIQFLTQKLIAEIFFWGGHPSPKIKERSWVFVVSISAAHAGLAQLPENKQWERRVSA